MKDTSGQNEHNGRERDAGESPDETLTELMASYTPRQRKTFLKGPRILTRVAIRTHMERQASWSQAAPDDGGEEEG